MRAYRLAWAFVLLSACALVLVVMIKVA